MSDIDIKKIATTIIIVAIITLSLSLIPLISYCIAFKNLKISTTPSDWSAFGSYLSGSVGVLLSFFTVVFTLISIYFTTRIAKYIQDNDFNFRTNQASKEIEITHIQSRPFPYIDLQRLPKKTSITIQNMGLGPLIVTQITIRYKNAEQFSNVKELFQNKLQINTQGAQITYNSAPNHILAPNASKSILQINPTKENNENFKDVQSACRNILKNCEIQLSYEDIFGNTFEYKKELSFLREESTN